MWLRILRLCLLQLEWYRKHQLHTCRFGFCCNIRWSILSHGLHTSSLHLAPVAYGEYVDGCMAFQSLLLCWPHLYLHARCLQFFYLRQGSIALFWLLNLCIHFRAGFFQPGVRFSNALRFSCLVPRGYAHPPAYWLNISSLKSTDLCDFFPCFVLTFSYELMQLLLFFLLFSPPFVFNLFRPTTVQGYKPCKYSVVSSHTYFVWYACGDRVNRYVFIVKLTCAAVIIKIDRSCLPSSAVS